jgi:hypothetical protein
LSSGVAANSTEPILNSTAETEKSPIDGTQIVQKYNNKLNYSTNTSSSSSANLSTSTDDESEGDTETFNILNFTKDGLNRYEKIDATLELKNPKVKIFVQDGIDGNTRVSSSDVNEMATAFNDTIRPQLENDFGTWNDFDNDGRLTILVYDIRGPIAGYHNSLDYSNTIPISNQRDMVYMDETQSLDNEPKASDFNITLTQEVSHAINYNLNQGLPTTSWLDEAVANYAEYVVYESKNTGFTNDYLDNVNSISLTKWNQTRADYGASFLYGMYLSEHYGDLSGTSGFMADLMRQPLRGEAAVDATLADYGYSDRFDDTLRNWTVANKIDNDSVSDKYGYSNIDTRLLADLVNFGGIGDRTETNKNVEANTAGYIELRAQGNAETVNYDIQNTGPLADIDPILFIRNNNNEYIISSKKLVKNGSFDPNVIESSANISTSSQASNASTNIKQNSLPTVPDLSPDNTVVNATEYEMLIILPNTGRNTTYDFSVSQIPDKNRFSGEISPGENATYAIPVNKVGEPNPSSVYEWNNNVFVSTWSTGSGDIQADLTSKNRNEVTTIRPQSGTNAEEFLGTAPATESDVWRLDINTSTQTTPYSVATRYMEGPLDGNQVFRLPSALEISPNNQNLQAGSSSTSKAISFRINVSAAGTRYTSQPFESPDKSHFNVTIGGKKVDKSNINIVSKTQGQYDLVVFPPSQSSNGQYDLNVSFTDEKFGVSDTATGGISKGVSYSGTTASGSTSVTLVLDKSGSMSIQPGYQTDEPTKMAATKTAAKQFLDQYSNDDRVSIISFDASAQTRSGMQLYGGNETTVENSISSIPNDPSGLTDIPAGMEAGLNQLTTTPKETSQATIIMTDGRDSDAQPGAITLANEHNARDHCIYTVAFGSGADDQLLKDIKNQSSCGGFRDTTTSGTDIGDIYRDLSATTSGLETFDTTKGTVNAGSSTTKSVAISTDTDSTVLSVKTESSVNSAGEPQNNTTKIQTSEGESIKVRLYYPNGTQVKLNKSTESGTENPQIEYSETGDTQTYQINDPQPGEWEYQVENIKSNAVDFTAEASGSTQTTLTLITDSQRYTNGSTTDLSAVLTGPNGSISDATVTATIEAPDGTTKDRTLTKESNSSGYDASISVPQTGEYSAAVTVSNDNLEREKDISWPVVSKSSLLKLSLKNRKEVIRGNEANFTVSITRPSTPSPAIEKQDTEKRSVSAFDSEAKELAELSKSEIENANVSDDLTRAALQIKRQTGVENQTRDIDNSPIRASSGGGGSTGGSNKKVYLTTSALTSEKDTIPAAQVQANLTAASLSSGETQMASITVSIPADVEPGIYNGTVTGIISGSKIQSDVSVNVTRAGEQTFQLQIQSTAEDWNAINTNSGKALYEEQIGEVLTNKYFGAESGS